MSAKPTHLMAPLKGELARQRLRGLFKSPPLAELARQRLRERKTHASRTFTPRPLRQNLRFCHLPFQGRLERTLLVVFFVIFHKSADAVL